MYFAEGCCKTTRALKLKVLESDSIYSPLSSPFCLAHNQNGEMACPIDFESSQTDGLF